MSPKTVLKERRNDVLAAGGDQELFLATGDLREPLLVEQSDIARCGTIRRRGPQRWRLVVSFGREDAEGSALLEHHQSQGLRSG
jgi:hypothetical protein